MLSFPFRLERSIAINGSLTVVMQSISDFKNWRAWSPWLCQEPECKVEIQGPPNSPGHELRWEGKRIGSGEIILRAVENSKSLLFDLNFLKPWKSQSKATFRFSENNGVTHVRWGLDGSLPFFMFFFKKMMAAWIGSDYERGLKMLKEHVETGKVPSNIGLRGVVMREPFHAVVRRRSCSTEDVSSFMYLDFTEMGALVEAGTLPRPDMQLSFYNKFDMVHRSCDYGAAFGYFKKPQLAISTGLEAVYVEPHQALQIEHFGPYRFLGNAWATAFGAQRALRLKKDKSVTMYEVYKTMPGQVKEEDILTEIFMPVR